MAANGLVLNPALSARSSWPRRPSRKRAEALLGGIETLQSATKLCELVAGAALEIPRLIGAAAAVVYLEGPEAGPHLAASGAMDGATADARAAMVRELVPAGMAAPYVLLGKAGTLLVSRFRAGALRGAILAERRGAAFEDADGWVLTAFAGHLGAAAAVLSPLEGLRQSEQLQSTLLDALGEGALVAVEGRVALLNRTGARLLSINCEEAIGRAVELLWPELAGLLARDEPVDQERMRLGDRDLRVTVRRLRGGRQADSLVRFSEQRVEEGRARQSMRANPLFGFTDFIGRSAAIAAVRELALVAARSSSGLLIEGESGVGKEVLAQAIHSGGPRSEGPFIAVHCAAIPRELLESELFGYEAGTFTGASPHGRAGRFELAEGGTLLLDDIVELPLDMQAKLLRALQERAVTRLGGSRPRPVNARIVATSNRPIREALDSGRFRPDLFYRLNVLHIVIPPLREHPEDVGPLAEHFLRRYGADHGRRLRTIGAQALRSLESYPWPGNVRELEHWIESEIHFAPADATCLERLTRDPVPAEEQHRAPGVRPIREVEREAYAAAIAAAAGDLSRAARELGVSRGKLYRKLRLYGLSPR